MTVKAYSRLNAFALRAINKIVPPSQTTIGSNSLIFRRSYHENIVEHYENPRNVGSLDKNDSAVGTVSAYK